MNQMFENFKMAVTDNQNFDDQKVETFFWLLYNENDVGPKVVGDALELLDTHRTTLAKKIAKTILEAATESMDEHTIH